MGNRSSATWSSESHIACQPDRGGKPTQGYTEGRNGASAFSLLAGAACFSTCPKVHTTISPNTTAVEIRCSRRFGGNRFGLVGFLKVCFLHGNEHRVVIRCSRRFGWDRFYFGWVSCGLLPTRKLPQPTRPFPSVITQPKNDDVKSCIFWPFFPTTLRSLQFFVG